MPENARSALFFLFKPTSAEPNQLVTVRTAGTPENFELGDRLRPFQRPIRLYLVPNASANMIHSRFDRRIYYIGSLVPDARGRGLLSFVVPPLDAARYAVAAWCPSCARYSRGRTFFVLQVGESTVARYRSLMLLRLRASSATCPVTMTSDRRYGTNALWTTLPTDGVLALRPAPDGSIGDKLGWIPGGLNEERILTVRGRMLDAPFLPLRVLAVRWGYSSVGRGSWASAVIFPQEGCWEITGRVDDVTLTYVLKVVRG